MFDVELVLLVMSVLFLISLVVSKAGGRFGVPVLLLFLAVGMVFSLRFRLQSFEIAQAISTFALSIILFSGGLDTKYQDIKPIVKDGIVLSTIGVLLTAVVTGCLIYLVIGLFFPSLDFSLTESLLLASIVSSTDSASVFAILRSKGVQLKNNLRPLLELESGSNDPMAYLMTITLISVLQAKAAGIPIVLLKFGGQIVIGAAAGYFLGMVGVKFINRINLANTSLYPVFLFASCAFIFSITYYLGGNGYLAVYLGGLVFGNSRFVTKRTTLRFFDGFAWISQITLFLTLGLLADPIQLVKVAAPGILLAVVITFIGRPVSVFASLLPFRINTKSKLFVSWVGLRGAVPIVFAILPLVAEVKNAPLIFNMVFFTTIISLLLQGTTFTTVADKLDLSLKETDSGKFTDFDVEFEEDIKSAMTEIVLTESIIAKGNTLMQMKLPEGTLAVMVKRAGAYFIPKGNTELQSGDKLLVITDNEHALRETYKAMGIQSFHIKRNA